MVSAAVIQRALLPKVDEFVAETRLDVSAPMTPARDVARPARRDPEGERVSCP
jgi:hypothetical protein